jgi:hypothetical protein
MSGCSLIWLLQFNLRRLVGVCLSRLHPGGFWLVGRTGLVDFSVDFSVNISVCLGRLPPGGHLVLSVGHIFDTVVPCFKVCSSMNDLDSNQLMIAVMVE